MLVRLVTAAAAAALGVPPASPRPHIVFLLADDLGFYDTALYNPASPTPALRALSQQGILLDRHYVYRYCSPTRRSFLSGRLPNRITTVQPDNCPLQQGGVSENVCSDFLPLAVQTLPEKLAASGAYESHYVGKARRLRDDRPPVRPRVCACQHCC